MIKEYVLYLFKVIPIFKWTVLHHNAPRIEKVTTNDTADDLFMRTLKEANPDLWAEIKEQQEFKSIVEAQNRGER